MQEGQAEGHLLWLPGDCLGGCVAEGDPGVGLAPASTQTEESRRQSQAATLLVWSSEGKLRRQRRGAVPAPWASGSCFPGCLQLPLVPQGVGCRGARSLSL